MKVCVVIAAYNESAMIATVVNDVKQYVDNVVVVDDGSSDNTLNVAQSAGATVLPLPINRGQGAALDIGIQYAISEGYEVIVTYDADGQFLANQIQRVIDPVLAKEVDVVLGSRFIGATDNLSLVKKSVLKIAIFITKFYVGLNLTDVHNGFRAFSVVAAKKIHITQDRMAHASEILEQIRKHQLTYKEVPVTVQYSDYSIQKGQKVSGLLKISWDLLVSRIIK